MSNVNKNWTGNIQSGEQANQDMILKQLCHAFNTSPFFKFNHMQMRPVDGHIEAYVEMQPELVGNVAFQILHGGVAATLLDSLGGVVTMAKLYSQAKDDDLAETSASPGPLTTQPIIETSSGVMISSSRCSSALTVPITSNS